MLGKNVITNNVLLLLTNVSSSFSLIIPLFLINYYIIFFLLNFVEIKNEFTDISDEEFYDEVPNTTAIDCLSGSSTESNSNNIMDISQTQITITNKKRGRREIIFSP